MPDMLMSDMLDTVRKAQQVIGEWTGDQHDPALAEALGKVGDFLDEAISKVHEEKACIRMAAFDADGHCTSWGVRSSSNPQRDKDNMLGFLEMRDAFELRGVPVRFKLGSIWVTSDVPPELEKPAFKAPPVHAAAKLAIDLAEANGQVLRVYSKPNPFELRMGGHYMVYELRDNLATARTKAAQLVKIVRGSNYDEEMFFETFWEGGKELTRDEGRMQVNRLNNDPDGDDRYYWRVVEADYKLYKWEP